MFDAALILIVEDEVLIALDLADAVTEFGGRLAGPFATVREAMAALESEVIAGAILDAILLDRDITPVASYLAERGIPLVIHSGTGLPRDLAVLHPDLAVVGKPAAASSVVSRLEQEMRVAQGG